MEHFSRRRAWSRRTFLALAVGATLPVMAMGPISDRSRRRALAHGPLTPFSGPARARRVLAVYFDYHCPYCRAMDPLLRELAERNRDLQIEYKELPVLRWDSETAARIALAAQLRGRFAQVHERLMRWRGEFTGALATSIAESLEVDPSAFRRQMGSSPVTGELRKNLNDADALGIEATPGIVTAHAVMQGALNAEELQTLVNGL